ncbi:MAG: TolC family protein [Chthoniobacterales bacterium]
MRLQACIACSILAGAIPATRAELPRYTIDDAIQVARAHNPDIAVAQKNVEAARGELIEARSGYLPAVVTSGLYRERERQGNTSLRPDDYNANIRVVESIYAGGATASRMAIARLKLEKAQAQMEVVADRVTMEVRLAFYELLLNREQIHVREESVDVLQQELKSQRERFSTGTVGELNVRRAEVSVANEKPELFQARTDLQNSLLRLSELLGANPTASGEAPFRASGELIYEPRHPNLNDCLAHAIATRPEIRAADRDIAIEEQQLRLDRSATQPRVDFFSGYEVYNERDPTLGGEFNHGYIIGLNASWALFDGFATRGKMQATQARKEAAMRTRDALRLTIASEVRSAFLDLEQADRVLASETKSVETAEESLQIANGNLAAGLGTQLDVLQAASDLTRTRTTRLSATYLHNAALARLDRACGGERASLGGKTQSRGENAQVLSLTRPPATLGGTR